MFFYIKQKTSYEMRISDWSSDVCSSDLLSRVRAITTAPMQDVRWDGCGDLSGPQTRRSIGQTGDRPPSCSCDFRSEEHTSELQSLMRISYAVFCLKKKTHQNQTRSHKEEKYNKNRTRIN